MPTTVTCSICKKNFFMTSAYINKNIKKYNVDTRQNLNLVYICTNCRRILKKNKKIENSKRKIKEEFQKISKIINENDTVILDLENLNPNIKFNFNNESYLQKNKILKEYDTNHFIIFNFENILNIKNKLQNEVDILIKEGLNNISARNNFIKNIKIILENEKIFNYQYVVENNILKGIKLLNIPIFGEIFIKLKSQNEQNINENG